MPLIFILICLANSPAARGQDWAKPMFDHTSHDFGVVARGAEVEHRFKLKNIYLEDVRIKAIQSSCGCTTPRVEKSLLKTYEETEVVATLDTRRFSGRKEATLTVAFDLPFPAEVQLHVYSYIRSDVVLQPGAVTFGSVPQGRGAEQRVLLNYAGSNAWRIVGVERANPAFDIRVQETGRTNSTVTYDVLVELKKEAAPGYFRDYARLVTNDLNPQANRVILPIEGMVLSSVSVRPSPLSFGIVRRGQSSTRNLVIQADAAFRVLNVLVPDSRFTFKVPSGSRNVQLVPVTFASAEAGRIAGQIEIETDRPGSERLRVPLEGQVVPDSVTASVAPAAVH